MVRYTVALGEDLDSWRALEWADAVVTALTDSVRLLTLGRPDDDVPSNSEDRLRTAESRLAHHHPGLPISRRVVRRPELVALLDDEPGLDVLVVDGAPSGLPTTIGRRLVGRTLAPVVVVPVGWSGATGPVVVGVDGRTAEDALAFGAETAARLGTTLVLVRSWTAPTHVSPYGMVSLQSDREVGEHESQLELDAAMRMVGAAFPDLRVRAELHQGPATDVLTRAAESAGLVVMGRRHHSVMQMLVTGSIGRRVMLRSSTPVCVVPPPPRHWTELAAADEAGAWSGAPGSPAGVPVHQVEVVTAPGRTDAP